MNEYKPVSICEWITRRNYPSDDGHDLQKPIHMQIGLYVMQCFVY